MGVKNCPGGLGVLGLIIGRAFTQSPTPTTALMLAWKGDALAVRTMFLLATIHRIMAV